MRFKKIIAGIIISIVTVSTLIMLMPVFIYGFGVQALSFDLGLGLAGTPGVSSSQTQDSYSFMDYGSTSTFTTHIEHVNINPYEYFFRKFEEPVRVEDRIPSDLGMSLDIVIHINISTPTGKLYELTYTLEELMNTIQHNMNILLGSDEIEIVSGTYEIWIILEIYISIPELSDEETFIFGPFHIIIEVIIE